MARASELAMAQAAEEIRAAENDEPEFQIVDESFINNLTGSNGNRTGKDSPIVKALDAGNIVAIPNGVARRYQSLYQVAHRRHKKMIAKTGFANGVKTLVLRWEDAPKVTEG